MSNYQLQDEKESQMSGQRTCILRRTNILRMSTKLFIVFNFGTPQSSYPQCNLGINVEILTSNLAIKARRNNAF